MQKLLLVLGLCCCSLAQSEAPTPTVYQPVKIRVNKRTVRVMNNHFVIRTNTQRISTRTLRSDKTGLYILRKDIIGRAKDGRLGLCEDCREFHTGGGNCGGGYGGGVGIGGDPW